MRTTEPQRSLLALCAIRVQRRSVDWSLIAREAQFEGGLELLWNGELREQSSVAETSLATLRQGIRYRKTLLDRVDKEIAAASSVGARLITVLDDSYPWNLRLSPNPPPFIFACGDITTDDARSVSVIGSSASSDAEIQMAQHVSELLADHRVTVVSGLEGATDQAVHRATLKNGGRTLAVLGAGIAVRHSAEIHDLAIKIEANGALVSAFWPTRTPERSTTPRRQAVTSELSQGAVIVEESSASRARMLARIAREQGKKVFVFTSLIAKHNWAKSFVARRGVLEITHVDEIVAHLALPERLRLACAQRRDLTPGLL